LFNEHITIVARLGMRRAIHPLPHSSSKRDVYLRKETILPLIFGVIFLAAAKSVKHKKACRAIRVQFMLNAVCCFDIFFQIKEFTDNVELSYKNPKKYKGTLIIKNATYADTGYYYCVSNETAECNIKMEGAHGKYVYVKGEYKEMLMSLLSYDVFEFLTQSLEYTT
jgi:hypothetical protein